MIETYLQILVMLLATNGAPVLLSCIFKSHGATPLDLGRKLKDGQPLFGSSKTWRGLIVGIFTSSLLAILFGQGIIFGLIFGALVMAGDLLSSFIKRRKGLKPSAQSLGWDQLPESLLPSLYAIYALNLEWLWAIALTLSFMLIQMLVSVPLYYLKIRKRPY